MRLFYYGKKENGISRKIVSEITSIFPANEIELFQTIASLRKKICQIDATPDVFVFFPVNTDELSCLIELKCFLNGPVILVLPDRNDATIHDGHLLQPRYLTFWDSNPVEIKEVLLRMMKGRFMG